jgi:hypothetical protein
MKLGLGLLGLWRGLGQRRCLCFLLLALLLHAGTLRLLLWLLRLLRCVPCVAWAALFRHCSLFIERDAVSCAFFLQKKRGEGKGA